MVGVREENKEEIRQNKEIRNVLRKCLGFVEHVLLVESFGESKLRCF